VRIDDTTTAMAGEITADLRNNVVANWHTGYGTIVWYGPWVNVVNNVYASAKHRSALEVTSARVFAAGNVVDGEHDVNRLGTEPAPFAAAAVDIQDACGAARLVLARAGVRPLDARDQQLLGGIALPPCPTPSPVLVAQPASLTFRGTEKGGKPAEQTLSIAGEGAEAVAWTATVSTGDGGPWLTATPAAGTTPGRLVVEADVSGLAAGTYPATVSVTAPGASAAPLTIPVELVVAPAPATATPPGPDPPGGSEPARSP
jgi:hypothetical protein